LPLFAGTFSRFNSNSQMEPYQATSSKGRLDGVWKPCWMGSDKMSALNFWFNNFKFSQIILCMTCIFAGLGHIPLAAYHAGSRFVGNALYGWTAEAFFAFLPLDPVYAPMSSPTPSPVPNRLSNSSAVLGTQDALYVLFGLLIRCLWNRRGRQRIFCRPLR